MIEPHQRTWLGEEMYALLVRLFPICRSITGPGVRQTLDILAEHIPLQRFAVPSGTRAFDWIVPKEWRIKDAYIKDKHGQKIVDFHANNLHVLNYSTPIEGTFHFKDLEPHLHTLPELPEAVPYITSYYSPRWGFCLSEVQKQNMSKQDNYQVKIKSSLTEGVLDYGDLVIPGASSQEILISTYVCHPSMANNELSGPIIATFLAKELLNRAHRKYTYRFVFVPETIGSIVYISKHLEHLKQHVLGGYVITCAGDSGPFSFLQSKTQSSLINRITEQILKESNKEYKLYSFLDRGSDERQYSSPGVDLDIGSLMRSKHGTYPEYHTSLDNLDFVRPDSLYETYDMYLRCIEVLEHNDTYQAALCCEPQLGPRGLYPTLGTRQNKELVRHTMDTLAYCDGRHDTLALSQITGYPFAKTRKLLQKLAKEGLVHKV